MNPICKQCGKHEVEDERVCYATPVCYACLPPPSPLPVYRQIPVLKPAPIKTDGQEVHCPICEGAMVRIGPNYVLFAHHVKTKP